MWSMGACIEHLFWYTTLSIACESECHKLDLEKHAPRATAMATLVSHPLPNTTEAEVICRDGDLTYDQEDLPPFTWAMDIDDCPD